MAGEAPVWERAINAVEDQFALAKSYGDESRTRVEELLVTLQEIGTSLRQIDVDVALADLNYTVPVFSGEKPTAPPYAFNPGTKPTKDQFEGIDLSDITIPNMEDLSISHSDIDSAVVTYGSSLLTALQTRLLADIQMDIDRTSTETNKAARAQERLLLKHNDMLDKIRAEWSQSNLPYPDGALVAALEVENTRYADEYSDLNRTIFIAESDLALKTRETAIAHSVQIEQVLMNFLQTTKNRIFEASKATVEAELKTYEITMNKYKIMADIYQSVSNVRIQEALAKVQNYTAEVQAYKAEIEAEAARIDGLVKIFASENDAYKTEAQVYNTLSQTEVEILKAQLQLAVSRATLYQKNAELAIAQYQGQNNLKVEVAKAMGQVIAQEVSGILSSIQANASMSRQDSASYSETHQYTEEE
jgi:hypothetical protein